MSTALVDALVALGVTHAFGVMGGAIAPLFRAVAHSAITSLHMRHESGAAFAATEASLATRRPALVFTTAGPGVTNVVTGLLAARWEGAHVILVSAATSAANRGRVATQETVASTDLVLHEAGGGYLAATVESPRQLPQLIRRLAMGLARPGGFIAHLSLPIDVQGAPCPALATGLVVDGLAPRCAPELIAEHAASFVASPPVLWLGFGARHAAAPIRRLAERLGARVMCSPRAKGVFPEDHPLYLGVTGVGGHVTVASALAQDRPRDLLVLGTRLGEATSFWSDELLPRERLIHVDVDPAVFGQAYPHITTEPVVAELGSYVDALCGALGSGPDVATVAPVRSSSPARLDGPVRPQHLIAELQRVVVDGSDAWLMSESGNAFCWANHGLRFAEPGRYRVSTGWGSMGHAATGVVGAALARGGKAVALLGDGAMMMQNELHAAVQHRADALWVILNDACYLMCAQGMSQMGWTPFSCELPRVDFAAMARAIGAGGETVTTEAALGPALERAMAARGPWVLDVAIDPREQPPSGARNKSLMQQGYKS